MNIQQEISIGMVCMDDDLRQMRNVVMWMALAAVSAALLFGGCHWINQQLGTSDDNIVEESLEDATQQYTGAEVDLTPGSPETSHMDR